MFMGDQRSLGNGRYPGILLGEIFVDGSSLHPHSIKRAAFETVDSSVGVTFYPFSLHEANRLLRTAAEDVRLYTKPRECSFTYVHRQRRIGDPVRSRIHINSLDGRDPLVVTDPVIKIIVVGWVTTSESRLMYVLQFSPSDIDTHLPS